jgi:phosphatidylglycerophosphate synthase
VTLADAYAPIARRPIADGFRVTAKLAVRVCVRYRIHPDAVSYASIVASGIAGVCFWRSAHAPWLLLVAPGFCYVRLWLNMLDGMVALASGNGGPRGEIVNDLPDRVSDIVIFVGVAHSGFCAPISGYWAALLALLTAYVGLLGQAVGAHREYSGVMSKPWRMVALHIGAWLTWGCFGFRGGNIRWEGLTILDWTCLVVIAGCVQTIAIRLKRILADLADNHTRI